MFFHLCLIGRAGFGKSGNFRLRVRITSKKQVILVKVISLNSYNLQGQTHLYMPAKATRPIKRLETHVSTVYVAR